MTNAEARFNKIHIRKVYACLAVTCHLHFGQNDRDFLRATVVIRGWNGYRNVSQHRLMSSRLRFKRHPDLTITRCVHAAVVFNDLQVGVFIPCAVWRVTGCCCTMWLRSRAHTACLLSAFVCWCFFLSVFRLFVCCCC